MVVVSGFAMLIMLIAGLVIAYFAIGMVTVRFGRWAKAYTKLSNRYHGNVFFPMGKPRMSFSYGDNHCVLKNTTSRHAAKRQTQLISKWQDRKLKLLISSTNDPSRFNRTRNLQRINIEAEKPGEHFSVFTNMPEIVNQMLNSTTIWQIRQLMAHHNNSGVDVSIQHGQMRVSKLGYIKRQQQLDDFVRYSLELHDQFKLTFNQEIEFVASDEPAIVEEVTCPICSGTIYYELVTCVRCRTPHCADCWEYNGQCATYACNETRCIAGTGQQITKTR